MKSWLEKKSGLVYVAGFALVALYYSLPLLLKYDWWGVRDWDQFTTMAAVPVTTILEYGQFPFWNPYLGGGNIYFHHPEAIVLSPFLLLYILFGAVVGLKIQVLICYFLGLWGGWKMLGRFGLSDVSAAIASMAWFGSIFYALHFAEGHISFTHFCFLPWLIYFASDSKRRRSSIAWGAGCLALMILGGGAGVPLLYTVFFGGLLFVLTSVESRNGREVARFCAVVVLGAALAAVKFIPMLVYAFHNDWPGSPYELIPLSALPSIFFGWNHSLFELNFEGQKWAWHEYGAYISPVLILLAGYAAASFFRRMWVWVVLLVLFLLHGLGDFGVLSPWAILSELPGFASMRATGRSFQFVILAAAVLGGYGLDRLMAGMRSNNLPNLRRLVLVTSAALVLAPNLVFAWPILSSAARRPPEYPSRNPVFEQVVDREPRAYYNFLANRGSLVAPWVPMYHPSRGLVGPDNAVYLEYVMSGKARVVQRLYTPNRIEYRIYGDLPGDIIIGMGFDPGWRSLDGRMLYEREGLISFSFERGLQEVVLFYRTPYFYTGLMGSLVGLIAAGLLIGLSRREQAAAGDSHTG